MYIICTTIFLYNINILPIFKGINQHLSNAINNQFQQSLTVAQLNVYKNITLHTRILQEPAKISLIPAINLSVADTT